MSQWNRSGMEGDRRFYTYPFLVGEILLSVQTFHDAEYSCFFALKWFP